MIAGGPDQILQGDGGAELAAEEIELLRRLRTLARGDRLAAYARGEIADDDRHDHEGRHGDDILRVGDRGGVERRQEEVVVGDDAEQAGEERRPQPVGDGTAEHGGEEDQGDIQARQELLQSEREGEGQKDHGRRARIGPPSRRLGLPDGGRAEGGHEREPAGWPSTLIGLSARRQVRAAAFPGCIDRLVQTSSPAAFLFHVQRGFIFAFRHSSGTLRPAGNSMIPEHPEPTIARSEVHPCRHIPAPPSTGSNI